MKTNTQKTTRYYLTFNIGKQEFGVEVETVLNILKLQEIMNLPETPEYMKGVINLRGKVVPVIDIRLKFGMTPTEYTDSTCIIVMDIKIAQEVIYVGTLVDSVVAVLEIEDRLIESEPGIGTAYKSEFILGVAKLPGKFIMLLDFVKILTTNELDEITIANKNVDNTLTLK